MVTILFEQMNHFLKNSSVNTNKELPQKSQKKVPYDFQQQAIDIVIKGLNKEDRGQLILPCGTGKTLISLWIYEQLNPQHTLVLFPSLALLHQTKNEWLAHAQKPFSYMCVCSEKDIDSKHDAIRMNLKEIGGIVSTEPPIIHNFLNKHDQSVIFSTYQSLESVAIALQGTNLYFDLALCDEAHKTAGIQRGVYGLIHDQSRIPVHKRLYMTATPRVLTESVKSRLRANEEAVYIADMRDPKIFGKEFHRMSFKEAIDLGVLVDYKIVAIGVTDKELQGAIREEAYIDKGVKVEEIANNYALGRFMAQYQTSSIITFHSSVKGAADFKKRHQKLFNGVKCFHVNGTQSTRERHKILSEFVRSPKSIVTNARCLTEGVNIPAVDGVFFCDPKNSKIDIVQAAGRTLRQSNDHHKAIGYIVVPIYHRHEDNLENVIENGVFVNLINVIRALSNQDERIIDTIRQYTEDQHWLANRHAPIKKQPIEFLELGSIMQSLKEGLFAEVVSKFRLPWRDFQEARQFVHNLSLQGKEEWVQYAKSEQKPPDIPTDPVSVYKDKGWVSWADWVGKTPKQSFRAFEEARDFARSLNLIYRIDWKQYARTSKKPDDIPICPDLAYKNKGWVSWPDWLGSSIVPPKNRMFLPFEEARDFARKLKLNSQNEWGQYSKSKDKPENIPADPRQMYKNKGWSSFGDWLGTDRVANQIKNFRPFEEARTFAQSLKLRSRKEWVEYHKSHKIPLDIPLSPRSAYENKGWVSWKNWLGTEKFAKSKRRYKAYEDAEAYVHALGIATPSRWRVYVKSGAKPDDIPACPDVVYKGKGWVSWQDWLAATRS